MTCYCDQGLICERHRDRPWPHDGCQGAGMTCVNPECPHGAGNRSRTDDAIDRERYPEDFGRARRR